MFSHFLYFKTFAGFPPITVQSLNKLLLIPLQNHRFQLVEVVGHVLEMAFDVFEGRDGAFSDVAGTDVLESVLFQQVLQGLAVVDDPVSPGRVELVDNMEGRFGDRWPVSFTRAGPLDIALVQRCFRVQVQIDKEPEIRGRDADGAGGFQDSAAFFQHIHRLRVIEMLEEVLGIDIVDGIVREREPF